MRNVLALNGHQLQGRLGDVFGADFELLDQFPGRARLAEAVFDADGGGDDGHAVELTAGGENGADAPGECADLMFLCCNHDAGLARRANDRLRCRWA